MFRDSRDFNLPLLAKQVWHLLIYPDSLLDKVMKGRYYRHSNPMVVGKASNPSYGWSSLWTARSILGEDLQRTIGTREDTKVWEDFWIPEVQARPALPVGDATDGDLKVHHLIILWNEPLLKELDRAEDIQKILKIRLSRLGRKDGYFSNRTKSGSYTVRAEYEVANEKRRASLEVQILEPSVTKMKEEVWSLKTSRKIKHFLWQSLAGFVTAASR